MYSKYSVLCCLCGQYERLINCRRYLGSDVSSISTQSDLKLSVLSISLRRTGLNKVGTSRSNPPPRVRLVLVKFRFLRNNWYLVLSPFQRLELSVLSNQVSVIASILWSPRSFTSSLKCKCFLRRLCAFNK